MNGYPSCEKQREFNRNSGARPGKSTIGLGAALCCLAASTYALSIAQVWPMETLSTSPLVKLSHGWTGGEIYDMTLEVEGGCTSQPVRLLFPTVSLAQDLNMSSPPSLSTLVTTPTIWVSYDLKPAERCPVHMVMQQPNVITGPAPVRPLWPAHRRQWTDYVDVESGLTGRFRLRFPLPPMKLGRRLLPERAPEFFTLSIENLDLGCTTPLTIRRTFPLNGREMLLEIGPRLSSPQPVRLDRSNSDEFSGRAPRELVRISKKAIMNYFARIVNLGSFLPDKLS